MKTLPDDIFDLIGRGLPIRNGGTGATTASSAFYNIVSALSTVSSASSSYYIPMQYSSSGRRISYTNLSNAIKNSVSSSLTPQDIGAATVEVGSYVGSGRNNSEDGDKGTAGNPMSITFSSAPKIVFIRDSHWTFYNQYSGVMETFPPIILMNSLSTSEFLPNTSDPDTSGSFYQMVRFKKSSNGRTLYYYGDNSYGGAAIWAFNLQGRTYWYAGIL